MILNKKSKEQLSLKIIAYIVTFIWCILLLLPLIFLFSSSMKDDLQIYDKPPTFLPKPPISISVVADYTSIANKGEAYLKDAILKDSTLAMYSIAYEINKSGVSNLEFYGTANNKVIYKSSSTKQDLQTNIVYLVYDRAQVNRKNLLEKYQQSAKIVGYNFNVNGLKDTIDMNKLGKNEFNNQIGDFLLKKYGIEGTYKGSIENKSYLYAIKNYIGYWKIPKAIFKDNEKIAKFSFLWFAINTLIIIVFAIIAQIFIDSLAAYALSRLFNARLSKILLIFILSASMIPFVAYMVPMYVMFQQLKFTGSYLGMLIPHTTAVGFFVYLYKGFIDKLPKDLFEAARIDGSNELRSYLTICLPLTHPVTAVIAINTLLGVWNDFFWPYLVASKESLWPLNVALYWLSQNSQIKQNFVMGVAALSLIPVFIVVILLGDNLKKGMVFTGIKG